MKLKGKVAIVTGASSGFGREVSIAFAREGASVAVSDIREKPLAGGFEKDDDLTTVEAIRKQGGRATFIHCDVTQKGDVQKLLEEVVRQFGRLEIMFNNAGIYRSGKLVHEFSEEDLDACYAVNVKGTFFGSQEAVKQFLRQGDGGNMYDIQYSKR
jgi:NAD(P)-dependent dehydrogenase (short-subunit alcohol dehydrogenase family)